MHSLVAADRPPIAFALDYPSLAEARAGALRVADAVGMLKIGLELFVEAGPGTLALSGETKLPIFLDLKLHDIPETVERAVARASALGARIVTVHASGGRTMLECAARRAEREGSTCVVAAVTVLTSLDASDLAALGAGGDVAAHALRLAKVARDAGISAFVCSAHEVRAMRAALGPDVALITPGVRSAPAADGARPDDQKRTATPARAIGDGADLLVIGRPIRDAADPLAAARELGREALVAASERRHLL